MCFLVHIVHTIAKITLYLQGFHKVNQNRFQSSQNSTFCTFLDKITTKNEK